jgi:sec-independent protein translocase protein TatC
VTLPDERETAGREVKPFLAHLDDLRRAVLKSLAAVVVGMLVAVPLAPWIITIAKIPLRQAGKDPDQFLRVIHVTGGVSIAMSIILWTGMIFSAPLVVMFVCQFIFPGLSRRERKAVLPAMGFAVALFALGVAVGAVMLLRVTLEWMLRINAWLGVAVDFWLVNDYVGFVLKLLLALGLTFEFPVVILALGRLGLVTARWLADKRRHVAVVILIVSAVVTPTVDPVTQTLFAAPLYVLYELCIWLVWAMERGRGRGSQA